MKDPSLADAALIFEEPPANLRNIQPDSPIGTAIRLLHELHSSERKADWARILTLPNNRANSTVVNRVQAQLPKHAPAKVEIVRRTHEGTVRLYAKFNSHGGRRTPTRQARSFSTAMPARRGRPPKKSRSRL